MSGNKFNLVEIIQSGSEFNFDEEYSKIHKLNQKALRIIADVKEVDTSKFTTPEDFANHFNELQKVSLLASDADHQLQRINDVYLAELIGRRKALLGQLEIATLSDKAVKFGMFSVQMLVVSLFFGFIVVGLFYGLFESNYHYILSVVGVVVFMAFVRRKIIPMAPGIQSQIDAIDEVIKEFTETALKNREKKALMSLERQG